VALSETQHFNQRNGKLGNVFTTFMTRDQSTVQVDRNVTNRIAGDVHSVFFNVWWGSGVDRRRLRDWWLAAYRHVTDYLRNPAAYVIELCAICIAVGGAVHETSLDQNSGLARVIQEIEVAPIFSPSVLKPTRCRDRGGCVRSEGTLRNVEDLRTHCF
jgi:hypothetical protein